MKKTIKDLFKLITAIATVAGILYVARDQIKAIIAKIKEVSDDDFDDDFDDESFDDDSFDDDEIFPEPSKDDRDYVSCEDLNPLAAPLGAVVAVVSKAHLLSVWI